ncbi:ATP-binding protein [Flavitalea sp. BT771]|uniref:AAA family ATPase n=1 Tax=Flavitalea sp. BT771 TaxID=3063329 RepID=UPI002948D291|nr:ATP-binding protein [Flavitalea sp. BT771]MDV6217851.1 ATP-binding protein [Flavitalea sp. BT771]
MIQYIKIKNFEAIKEEIELNFEAIDTDGSPVYEVEMPDKRKLLKLAYIYGPNASGKSTILKAIQFLRELWLSPRYKRDDELEFDPFLFQAQPENDSTDIDLAFYVDGVRYIYQLKCTKRSILSEKMIFYQTNQPSELFSRTTDLEKQVSYVQFGSKVRAAAKDMNALETATLHNNTVFGAFQKTNVDIPAIAKLSRWLKDFFRLIINQDYDMSDYTAYQISRDPAFRKWMNMFLNKADKNIREVTVKLKNQDRPDTDLRSVKSWFPEDMQLRLLYDIMDNSEIHFHHVVGDNKVYTLAIEKESQGSQRYFGLGGVLYSLLTSSGFVSIDELDTSLHADLMKHFLQLFLLNSHQSQLLFTTHNLFLLEEQDFIRKDALWFTEKGEDGGVNLYSAADFDSDTLRKGASLINAYKAGRLGAKPNLGSPYLNAP